MPARRPAPGAVGDGIVRHVNETPRSSLPVGRARLALIAVLGGVAAIGPLATDLYLPALPRVATDLGVTQPSVALTVSVFLVGLALGQVLWGRLSDTYGRRTPLLCGLAAFTVATFAGVLTSSIAMLIALRALQGFSGAAGIVIANAVVADHVRGTAAARLLSRLALVTFLAPILAPLVGAQLLTVVSWRGVFVVQGVLGLGLVAAVAFGLRESLPAARRLPFSLPGTMRLMGSLTRDRAFMGLALTNSFMSVGFYTYLSGSSLVLQNSYGASAAVFSVIFSVNAVGMLGTSQLNHLLLARTTPQRLLGAGLAAAVLAGVCLVVVTFVGGLSVVAFAAPLFVLVASIGLTGPNSTALALSLHADTAGSASAYFGTLRLAIGGLGASLVGLVAGVHPTTMAVAIAVATGAAACAFALVAARVRRVSAVFDMPEEQVADAPVG
jgi:MFS transporter, DHA1 family, multidrug resistance protein